MFDGENFLPEYKGSEDSTREFVLKSGNLEVLRLDYKYSDSIHFKLADDKSG